MVAPLTPCHALKNSFVERFMNTFTPSFPDVFVFICLVNLADLVLFIIRQHHTRNQGLTRVNCDTDSMVGDHDKMSMGHGHQLGFYPQHRRLQNAPAQSHYEQFIFFKM